MNKGRVNNFLSISIYLLLGLLALLYLYDHDSLSDQAEAEVYERARENIEDLLDSKAETLFDPALITLLSKQDLSSSELNQIKLLQDRLIKDNFSVNLSKGTEQLFWVNTLDNSAICTNKSRNDLALELCYHPFDEQGQVKQQSLTQSNMSHFYKLDETGRSPQIKGTSVKMGKKYRDTGLEYLLYFGYFILSFLILICSIKGHRYWPVGLLILSRIIAINCSWYKRFSIPELSESLFPNFSYTILDLSLDSLIIFGVLFLLTRRIKDSARSISPIILAGSAFLHLLLFLAQIRTIQFFMRSERLGHALEDLSSSTVSDMIFFFSTVLIQLGIFYFGTSLYASQRKANHPARLLYISYAISTCAAVVLAFALKLDLNPLILLIFLTAYLFMLDLFVDERSKTITWVIWWGIFFGVYLSALFFNFDIKRDINNRKEFLQSAFHQIPNESILDIKATKLIEEVDSLIRAVLILPTVAKYDKLDLQAYLNEKLDRNDLEIELHDKSGLSLFEQKKSSHAELDKMLKVDSLFRFDEIKNKLWFENKLTDDHVIHLGIDINHVDVTESFPFNYYRSGQLIHSGQTFTKEELQLVDEAMTNVHFQGSDVYVSYRPSTSRLLVSRKTFLGLVKPVTLFSFLFCIIIILVIIIGLLNLIFDFLPEDWPLFIHDLKALNSKIQISLILVILLSFVVIATITSSFLKNYLSTEKEQIIKEKLESLDKAFRDKTLMAYTPSETIEILANFEEKIEDIHNVELELHRIGNQATDLDYFTHSFFHKQPDAFGFTNYDGITKSYIPIYCEKTTELSGVAEIKLKNEEQVISQLNVFDFLGSIFNVYVFLFLIASVLAIFIAKSITRPIAILNQKLTQVKLESNNELISWEGDDEIGTLIDNYNKMVNKLEESAQILAKKERDSAWREMAKQVAHEIKNPLTPMKLSIQYLEKAISRNPDDAKHITKKISATILEQIDNLTGIAEAFGNFAELPHTSNVKIELNNIVEVVYNLFRKREDMDISLSIPIDPIYVYGDKGQLVRILNNLVKNATESITPKRRGKIELSLDLILGKAIIKVKDNGVGIPDDKKDKIFQPKFTTKDSGSGLGLAIAANMIESMNGKVYFESELDVFTCFYIELKQIKQESIVLD